MKHTLKRYSSSPAEELSDWKVQNLTLEGAELIEYLNHYLSDVMEGTLDPDVAGRTPDRFLYNLQSGRFGDFSQRYIITARDDDRVVGLLIGLTEGGGKFHIYSMGVLPAYRGKGVGFALLTRCINDMLKKDIQEVVLDVHSDNVPAYNLYKGFGFQ